MLSLHLKACEGVDERTFKIIHIPEQTILLEHSLISISKWEEFYKKAFLGKPKTSNEIRYYIKCMCLNPSQKIYTDFFSSFHVEKITKYIEDTHTATTFSNYAVGPGATGKHEVLTSELIYYYMFSYGVPKECEKWNINRLLTLLRVFSIKCSNEKMSKKDTIARNRALNKANKARYGVK